MVCGNHEGISAICLAMTDLILQRDRLCPAIPTIAKKAAANKGLGICFSLLSDSGKNMYTNSICQCYSFFLIHF
jgi:hypothetical protein